MRTIRLRAIRNGKFSINRRNTNRNNNTRIAAVDTKITSLCNNVILQRHKIGYVSHHEGAIMVHFENNIRSRLEIFSKKKISWEFNLGDHAFNDSKMWQCSPSSDFTYLRSNQQIQIRQHSNQSKGKDDSENTAQGENKSENMKLTHPNHTVLETNEDKENPKTSGIFSRQTTEQITSILEQAKSTPNLITLTRIFSSPLLSYFIITHQYKYAMIGCFLAGISDSLDGYIARKYSEETVLGTYLDPMADKIVINSLALSLSCVEILPIWSAGIWLGKDVIMIGMSYRAAALAARGQDHAIADPSRTPLKVEPTLISKINTVLQFGTLGIGLGMACFDIPSGSAMYILGFGTCGTTIASGLSYIDGKSMTNSGNETTDNSISK